jgi:prepilin signal peptidase PulO-like enzyme (type II secretory pathway)
MVALPGAQRFLTRHPPLIEAPAGLAWLATSLLVVLLKEPGAHRGLVGLSYLALLFLMAAHDVRTRRVPNRIVYPSLGFAVLASLTLGWSDAMQAILGGMVTFLVLLAVAIVGRGAMGLADVKVGALCGIAVGLRGVVPMLLITFASGALVAALVLVSGMRNRKDVVAFTPFLVAATALSMLRFHLYLLS